MGLAAGFPAAKRPAGRGGADPASGQVNPPAPWVVSDASSWIFSGTGLQNGSSIPGLVGYEYDRQVSNLPHPAQTDIVAKSPVTNVGGGQNVAQSTVYTAGSGAQVVYFGSIDWTWGLDNDNYSFVQFPYGTRPTVASTAAQTITTNIMTALEK